VIFLDLGGNGPGLIAPDKASVPALDRGLLYGDGIFETMRSEGGQVPLLPLHLERLARSAGVLALPLPSSEMLSTATLAVVRSIPEPCQAIRLTVTRGVSAQRGYAPPELSRHTLLISAAPYRPPTEPIRLCTASSRIYPGSPTWQHKSLSALDKVMARAEAARAGCDEALLLNTEGRVVEASSANLFVRRGDRWYTPSLAEGCLPGVMRRQVIRLSQAAETRIDPADLHTADAVYLTNALMGCLPVVQIDHRSLPIRPLPRWSADLFTLG